MKSRVITISIAFILFFVLIVNNSVSQTLQDFTFKPGLEFAMMSAKKYLGDSINLFHATSSGNNQADSYNSRGLSKNWGYLICNNDSCLIFIVNKKIMNLY